MSLAARDVSLMGLSSCEAIFSIPESRVLRPARDMRARLSRRFSSTWEMRRLLRRFDMIDMSLFQVKETLLYWVYFCRKIVLQEFLTK